jgi:hypothetical protein
MTTSHSLLTGALALLLGLGCGTSHEPSRPCAAAADCSDADPCTTGERCDPVTRTCASEMLDGDGDGVAPLICGGADCDDSVSGTRCEGDGGTSISAQSYCEGFQVRVCARDHATGRIDAADHEACVAAIPSVCSGIAYPAGCSPTEAVIQACYVALVDVARLDIVATFAMPNLPECDVCSPAP